MGDIFFIILFPFFPTLREEAGGVCAKCIRSKWTFRLCGPTDMHGTENINFDAIKQMNRISINLMNGILSNEVFNDYQHNS